jgi:hydrogenase nickel incorporation protein HypB
MTDSRLVQLEARILAKNEDAASALHELFDATGVRVANWISSPGTGKTALLEALLVRAAERDVRAGALVGDCATDNDAVRLARSGAPVRQIVTEGMCHLEADMIAKHLGGFDLADLDLLVIENVGNLVCPTSFDLGEDVRVALLSTTEGEDKPLKYPATFAAASIIVITKADIADAVEFDRTAAVQAIRTVNATAPIIETSAKKGTGLDDLLDLLLASPREQVVTPHGAAVTQETQS